MSSRRSKRRCFCFEIKAGLCATPGIGAMVSWISMTGAVGGYLFGTDGGGGVGCGLASGMGFAVDFCAAGVAFFSTAFVTGAGAVIFLAGAVLTAGLSAGTVGVVFAGRAGFLSEAFFATGADFVVGDFLAGAAGFLAGAFAGAGFLATGFFAAGFGAVGFATGFFTAAFLATGLALGFPAAGFGVDFFAAMGRL
jgi:hypothetical protein